jgi:hypothetical protein
MYKGTVLQYLRKYIKDLQADQLESYVLAGELTLHAIELEPDALSDWISDVLPYTVEIERVFCSKVDIKIPWAQLRTKPVQIAVHQMELKLLVHDFREQDWAVQQATVQKNGLIQSRIVELDKVYNPEKALKKMELSWVDLVAGGMQIRVEFCRMVLNTLSGSRIPPSAQHTCPLPVPPTTQVREDPVTAFTLDIEGLFVAPCHHQSGWSVSYVETPEQVYQYDAQEKLLRLSRLITLKSMSLTSAGSDKTILTHSPGFRMRLTSEFTCVNLTKSKRRFCIPSFPSKSNKALWMDKVNLTTSCSCELAAFYAMIQDLTAPVMVPPESLTQGNRPCHYTYKEEDILTAETEQELERLKGLVTDIKRPLDDGSDTASVASLGGQLPPIPDPKRPPKIKKKKGIVTSGSVHQDIRKLFAGLAKEVKDNASKAQQQMASTGKKIGSIFGSRSSNQPLSPIASSREQDMSPRSEMMDDFSPVTAGSSSTVRNRGRLPSRMGSDDSEYFTDAVSETGEMTGLPSTAFQDQVVEGHEDGFAMWLQGEDSDAKNFDTHKEFQMASQLVVVDKLNFLGFFHIHVNEFSITAGTVSVVAKKLDMTSESHTPLTMAQLGTLASFAQFPQLFLMHAQRLTKNVLLPSEPVHAATAISVLSLSIIANGLSVLKLEPKSNGVKSLVLKWKSRTPPPTRLVKSTGSKMEIETGRMQPWEGCIHGMSVMASGWTPFLDMFNQCMSFSGEFPDPSFDPIMRLRMIVRDMDLVVPESNYRFAVPSAVFSRNFSVHKIEELLSGFQTLSAIPSIHFADASHAHSAKDAVGYPFDGAFCSCVCGQESCSWSWALPSVPSQKEYPAKVKLGDSVVGSGGTVTERTWKRSLVHAQKTHVYVPSEDFASLLEAKLRLAEQDVVVDHLRDQYNAVMEEITKRNIFLKERWAADAVQTTSKENVVDVLTQKVCVLETLVRELTEERDLADRLVRATRAAAANEITNVRKELLEETQKLRHKLDTATVVQHSLNEAIARKDKETDHLKQQLEFLLGLGLRATNNVVTQTD